MDLKHTVKWYVSLSNGETFFEGKGDFRDFANMKSPWQRLIDYLIDHKVEITSLGLYTNSGKRFNLASAGSSPKFKNFENAKKPIDYQVERSVAREMSMAGGDAKVVDFYTVARAIYPTYELQLWVNNFNPDISWVYVKET